MSGEAVTVYVLLTGVVALTLACAFGVAAMPEPYSRLHYLGPPSSLAAGLLTIAVFIDEPELDAGLKTLLIAGLLVLLNTVVGHATGRAERIRTSGRLDATSGVELRADRSEGAR